MQIDVEGGSDQTHERTPRFGDGNTAALDGNDSVLRQGRQTRQFRGEIDRSESMPAGHGLEIDGEIAHQPLDNVRPQPVVVAEFDAACHGQFSVLDGILIGLDIDDVLKITLGQAADRRGAETDQDRRLVDRVTLEVAVQSAVAQGLRKAVAGPGEVIQADRHITGLGQEPGGRRSLLPARLGVGKGIFGDQLLVRLHPRNMGITEQGDPLRFQLQGLLDHGLDAFHRLVRQAVHQIQVGAMDAVLGQPVDKPLGDLEGLDPVDRLLNLGMEILDPDADPVDAGLGEVADVVFVTSRGSISTAISAFSETSNRSPIRSLIRRQSAPVRIVGLPPPQCRCVARAAPGIRSETRSISLSRTPR